MSDGKFELLLVKAPRDLLDIAEIIRIITTQDYNSGILTFVNCSNFTIYADKHTSWSLDGEYQEGCEKIEVENLHHAIELMKAGHKR